MFRDYVTEHYCIQTITTGTKQKDKEKKEGMKDIHKKIERKAKK
jgi:hypothetical protein